MANALMRTAMAVHAGVYRASRGRLLGTVGGSPVLLLTTRGRKSGKRRTIPLVYLEDERRFLIAASAGGSPSHPAWYHNLAATKTATIQVRSETIPVRIEIPQANERAPLWEQFKSTYQQFEDYEDKTDRTIPVIVLVPEH